MRTFLRESLWRYHHDSITMTESLWQHHYDNITMTASLWQHHYDSITLCEYRNLAASLRGHRCLPISLWQVHYAEIAVSLQVFWISFIEEYILPADIPPTLHTASQFRHPLSRITQTDISLNYRPLYRITIYTPRPETKNFAIPRSYILKNNVGDCLKCVMFWAAKLAEVGHDECILFNWTDEGCEDKHAAHFVLPFFFKAAIEALLTWLYFQRYFGRFFLKVSCNV